MRPVTAVTARCPHGMHSSHRQAFPENINNGDMNEVFMRNDTLNWPRDEQNTHEQILVLR